MAVESLPTGNFTTLCLAGILCFFHAIFGYFAFFRDKKEVETRRMFYRGHIDLIFRLRGEVKDSPLVLFRDSTNNLLNEGCFLNLGVAFPHYLGDILDIDLACDSDGAEEAETVISVSDIYVRKLTRSSLPRRGSSLKFPSDCVHMESWVSVGSVTSESGIGVLGVKTYGKGRGHILRARDVAETFSLTLEDTTVKKWAMTRYLSVHYLLSMSTKWHEPWSEFSVLDLVLCMCLDQLATLVVVCTIFAYGLEDYIAGNLITLEVKRLIGGEHEKDLYMTIDDFDIREFLSPSVTFFLRNAPNIVLCFWICTVACLSIIPISLIWCRLFRLIGGKGFQSSMHETLPTAISTKSFGEAPWPSKGPRCNARCQNMDYSNDSDNRNTLLLRTLECKSTHTASCVTSTRRLRMEPMITNCKPNNITARSVAYVRTKMTRLKDEDILSGARGIKEPEVLHESHSQSTDAPLMPVPATKADGKTEILRVARFCERLIQQGPEHIRDNSVITECFEVGEETSSGPDIGGAADERMCCPRQCCKKLMKCQQRESFSNATFFTEDDAASVKEMMSEFSITPSRDARPDVTPVTPSNAREVSAKPPTANNEKEKGDALRVLANMFQGAPAPASGGQQHKAEDQNPAPTTTTSTCSGSDFLPQQVLIGRSESNRRKSEMELALKRVGKQFRQVIGRTKGSGDKEKNPKNSTSNAETDKAPGPSGNIRFGGGDFGSQLTEEWDESKHSYDVTPMTKSPRHQVPFKGLRFKLLVFGFLAALQLAEIGFVCAYKWKLNLFYPTSDDELGTIVSNGRMHCAVLSSILAALFYFVISIQLVALCSSAIERLQLICSGPSYRVDDYYQVG